MDCGGIVDVPTVVDNFITITTKHSVTRGYLNGFLHSACFQSVSTGESRGMLERGMIGTAIVSKGKVTMKVIVDESGKGKWAQKFKRADKASEIMK